MAELWELELPGDGTMEIQMLEEQLIGSGDPIIYSISTTSDIYVRAEGNCDTSLTTSSTISIEIQTSDPTSISATQTTICAGNSIDLTVTGGSVGTSGTWAWYESDPNILVSPPLFLSASPIYPGLSPGITTTYYVRAEGCDTSNTAALTINVNSISIDATSILPQMEPYAQAVQLL